MNFELALVMLKGIGLAIGIGLAFLIIPFSLFLLIRMLPWFIWGLLFKDDSIGNSHKSSDYPFYKGRYNKQVYIDNCHPSQVIKRLRSDGLNSIFRNYLPSSNPINEPNTLCNEETPVDFLKSSNPIPIDNKLNHPLNHADNVSEGNEEVNQNGTIPLFTPRYRAVNIFPFIFVVGKQAGTV